MIRAAVLLLFALACANAQVKVALFPYQIGNNPNVLPDGFLDRISQANYTHIILYVTPAPGTESEWSGGLYQCPSNPALCGMKNSIYANFLRVGQWNKRNQKNLKIIPYFGLSNKWAAAYGAYNPAIRFNVWEEYQGKDKAFKEFGLGLLAKKTAHTKAEKCPAYIHNPEYHKTVKDLEKVAFQAYRDAAADPTASLVAKLDYVHLGFDEMYTEAHHSLNKLEKLGFGNSYEDNIEINIHRFLRTYGQSLGVNLFTMCRDRWESGNYPNPPDNQCDAWINTSDNSYPALLFRHELLLDELGAQINNAKSSSSAVAGNPASDAKFMVWGDIWDPQKAGGYFGFGQFIPQLADRFATDIVVAPWHYSSFYQSPLEANVDIDVKYEYGFEIGGQIRGKYFSTGHSYDATAALAAFTDKGLKVVFCSALKFGDTKIDYSSLRQVYNYSKACKANPNCIGYVAGIYGTETSQPSYDAAKGPYDQVPFYTILELLDVLSRRTSDVKNVGAILDAPSVRRGYVRFPGVFDWPGQTAVTSLLSQ